MRENRNQALRVFYEQVDRKAAELAQVHRQRLKCGKGCSYCCADDLTVFQVEAENIQAQAGKVLTQTPGKKGGCAFLTEEGTCRIYECRPYICRTQGLPLRWLETDENEIDLIEYRDICPVSEAGESLEAMPETQFWTLGPSEEKLAQLTQGNSKRLPLRSLFHDQG